MTYPVQSLKVSGSGSPIIGTAGEYLGDRKLVYIAPDGTWKLADADTAATMPGLGLTMGAISTGNRGQILIKGFIGLSTWTWNVAERLYASENVTGDLTQTAPSNPAYFTQEIGFPISATQIFFSPRQVLGNTGPTYVKTVSIPAEEMGRGAANNPGVVDQSNLTLYSFTLNTDFLTYNLPIPSDYALGGLKLKVVWTNDGGADDNAKYVKTQFNYLAATEGDAISGSHANSPKAVEDGYTSASGWIEHHSAYVTIAEADFTGKLCLYIKLSFITPVGAALTCEPHLIGICLQYDAYTFA